MSPHGIIFFGAIALGLAGKLVFPQSNVRVAFVAAITLPFFLALCFGDISPIAVLIIAPLSVTGAVLGVMAGWFSRASWISRHR